MALISGGRTEHDSTTRWDGQVARLARLVVPIVVLFLVVSLGPLWFHVFFPDLLLRRMSIVFLRAVEVIYGILL